MIGVGKNGVDKFYLELAKISINTSYKIPILESGSRVGSILSVLFKWWV